MFLLVLGSITISIKRSSLHIYLTIRTINIRDLYMTEIFVWDTTRFVSIIGSFISMSPNMFFSCASNNTTSETRIIHSSLKMKIALKYAIGIILPRASLHFGIVYINIHCIYSNKINITSFVFILLRSLFIESLPFQKTDRADDEKSHWYNNCRSNY